MNPENFRHSSAGRVIRSLTGDYWAFIPNPLLPPLTWSLELVNALSAVERALGKLDGLSASAPNPHLLTMPFMRREAALSSGTEAEIAIVEGGG